MISCADIRGIITKKSKDEKSTDSWREEREVSPAMKRLQEKFKKVPHPGTVRVTIFPNPRERRFDIDEDAYDHKNH